ncbi:MAG: AraC family transcriptional regulator [Ruminococcaceae bacterium]|nr:AraC family transcriptional regulator [Oscillospiraceae bacterium]
METIYEQFPHENPRGLIRCNQKIYKKSFSRIHWHKNIEIVYIISPTLIYLNGEEISGNPGEIIVINSNVLHDFKAPKDSDAVYHCLIFDEAIYSFFEFDSSRTKLKQIIRDKTAAGIIDKMARERQAESPYHTAAVKALVGELLIHLYRHFSEKNVTEKFNDNNIDLTREIIGYINANYRNNITLQEIADHTKYSKFYLIHIFKKVTGVTISEYINTVRVNEGARLIKKTGLSLGEVALEAGFTDQSYFSKIFKKYMGCTPREYINKE